MKCVMCHEEICFALNEDFNYIEEAKKIYPTTFEDVHICVKCAEKCRIDDTIKNLKPIFEQLSHFVNRSRLQSYQIKAIVKLLNNEHRYLQNEMIMSLYSILREYGKGSNNPMWEDARNKWALAFAKQAGDIEVIFNK